MSHKENDPCKVIDCIINPDVCAEMKKKSDKDLLSFFSDILSAYVQQKHGVELSTRDFRMPKLNYKGSYIDFQRVRAKKKPKIDLVDKKEQETLLEASKEDLLNSSSGSGHRQPDWKLKIISYENEDEIVEFDGFNLNPSDSKGVIIEMDLPLLVTGRHINLQVSQSVVAMICGKIYSLKIKIPFEIDPLLTQATFITKTRQLEVRVFTKQQPDDTEDSTPLTQAEKTASLLEQNYKKVQEHKIEIKSDLLNDIF